jgi:hypothetical protein
VEGIEEREEALAYRRRRIGPKKSAGVRHSDEKSLGLGGVSGGEGKRGEGGVRGDYIAAAAVGEGLGFWPWARSTATGTSGSGGTPAQGKEMTPIGGSPL